MLSRLFIIMLFLSLLSGCLNTPIDTTLHKELVSENLNIYCYRDINPNSKTYLKEWCVRDCGVWGGWKYAACKAQDTIMECNSQAPETFDYRTGYPNIVYQVFEMKKWKVIAIEQDKAQEDIPYVVHGKCE